VTIPDHQTIMLPLLRLLGDGADHTATSAIEALADQFDLSAAERSQPVGSQRILLIASRVHWAMTYLAQAGLTERPRRGVWRITDLGGDVLSTNPSTIDTAYLARFESFRDFMSRSGSTPEDEDVEGPAGEGGEGTSASLPTSRDLWKPVLDVVADGEPHSLPEVVQAISDVLNLDKEARNRRIPSGRTVIENRVGWARTALIKAGLVDQPEAGLVVITDDGRSFLAAHPDGFDDETLKAERPSFANWLADMGEVPASERSGDDKTAVWMVRAGEGGVAAPIFVQQSVALIGWGDVGDVTGLERDQILERVGNAWPDYRRIQRGQAANALFRFATDMRPGDVVITPEPTTRSILLGEVTGAYVFTPTALTADYRHTRPVRWLARISRDELSYGARNSLSTQMTLTRPPHEAELLRLARAHADDPPPAPVPQKAGRAPQEVVPERVVIPADAAAPPRKGADDFHTSPRKLTQLLVELDTGQLALPDFQRTFVWEPDETRELIVSMMRSFPAGALLLLQGGSATFKARAAEGAASLKGRPSFLVLDGQQRLTSLYQAIYGVGESRFFLDVGALLAGAEVDQAVKVFSVERARPFDSLEAQARTLMMPMAAVRDNRAARWRDQIVPLRDDDNRERVRDLLRDVEYSCIEPLVNYAFPVTILPEATPLEAVCTIFETLNRTGRPLTPFELISARAFAGGHSLYDYWNSAVDEHPILRDFAIEPYYLLQCIALRSGRSCKRRSVLNLAADDIASAWTSTVSDMAATLTMLRGECGVLIAKWLPYRTMLIPMASAWREVTAAVGPQHGAMRAKLKRWFWCAAFTGEYESSSATLAEHDTPLLREWLAGGDEPDVVRNFAWDPERWRTVTGRQQGLYRATIALSLVEHPRDFHTAAPLTAELIEAGKIDDHHLFPRGYLRDVGRDEDVDSVLNHCLIDRITNKRIGKCAPSWYLAEIRTELGPALDQVLQSHCLPVDPTGPLETDDYDGFLALRLSCLDELLQGVSGSSGYSPVATRPGRTGLDLQIEGVELELRRLIADRLATVDALPAHVRGKIAERLSAARRRNPAIGNGHYETLLGKLEYCDLRELQDVLTAKESWASFEPRFGTKEVLNSRFAQLSELRNRIRHSRTLDAVTQKDGEAALLWFRQVLASGGDSDA